MNTSKALKHGTALVLLSLLLALFCTVWPILAPRIDPGVSTFTLRSFLVFVGGCIGVALGILGIRQSRQSGMSWSLVLLSGLSLSLNGLNIFFQADSWLNPPEVKGIVQRIQADYIIINVDKDYLPEYSTAHLPDDFATDLVAGISSRTIFYEQYGNWRWQKNVVTVGNVHDGQHVQIQYNGSRVLTGDIIEASAIIVLSE